MEMPQIPTDNPNFSVNISEESKTAAKLIDTIKAGIGTAYKPIATILQAKADAVAAKVSAKAEIEIEEIRERAQRRIYHTEFRRQQNIDAIIGHAREALPASPESNESVDEDWTAQFFEHAKDVNSSDMQSLWGRILAGEVNKPGSYSLRTLSCLKTMTKQEAEIFTKMVCLAWRNTMGTQFLIDGPPLRNNWEPEAGEQMSSMLALSAIKHLANIGLINSTETMYGSDVLIGRPQYYFDEIYVFDALDSPNRTTGTLPEIRLPRYNAVTYFTQIGMQLSQLTEKTPVEDYARLEMEHTSRELRLAFHKVIVE